MKENIKKILYSIGRGLNYVFELLFVPFEKAFLFVSKIIGNITEKLSHNYRTLKKYRVFVDQILALEEKYQAMHDTELQSQTEKLKQRLSAGETLDDILVDAFAVVREASRRVLNMQHFPEQLLGGISLHKGIMTEMKTGEGKTLVATLPAYLNGLTGDGVHVVTVNDYLASRDAAEMGKIYRFLGLSVGCVTESLRDEERRDQYACDIMYVTSNQLGFDYLRDNMKYHSNEVCQRGLNFAIIDEADCVLIDEARTPLIISGGAQRASSSYALVSKVISQLEPQDYDKEEKMRTVALTDAGVEKVERLLMEVGLLEPGKLLYDVEHIELVHEINQSLKAFTLFRRDVDYIVRNGKISIVDEMTGRVLEDRRYSDGLHQAIEAKEHVKIQLENVTMASVTFQKFFALYKKIAGMSGTCVAESEEFREIYKVSTLAIPTHMPMIREDLDDEVYRTWEEKFDAILRDVKEAHEKQQPVLMITGSVDMSEVFSSRFMKIGLKHQVLNAHKHKEEAMIIADAGVPGAITIATNMAGRGTDIKLGGNYQMILQELRNRGLSEEEIKNRAPEVIANVEKAKKIVIEAGGLFVVGTERNESRRIDDQARGRSGRQGDPGKSKFFLSLQDDLIRIFASSSSLDKWLVRFGMKQGEAITHPFVTRSIAKAQAAVEARNFDMRNNTFKYDAVLDEQRKMIYKYRNRFLFNENLKEQMQLFIEFELNKVIDLYFTNLSVNHDEFDAEITRIFALEYKSSGKTQADVHLELTKLINEKFASLYQEFHKDLSMLMLRTIDDLWQNHLHVLDCLRQSVNLKAYAQKDPLNEYKKEGFVIFERLLDSYRTTILLKWFHLGIVDRELQSIFKRFS